jgi:hypothetical protein
MRKFLVVTISIVLALGAAYAVGVRFSDGPFGIIAGGPLQSGELIASEPDWLFAHDVPTIELQLLSPSRSRTVWMIEHQGKIYVPCGYRNTWLGRLWKQWPLEVEKDPRAIVRIDGKRYERTLIPVTSKHPAIEELLAELQRKYMGGVASTPSSIVDTDALLLFELAPRSS